MATLETKNDKLKAIQVLRQQRPGWGQNLILAGIRGSDAHGTKLPEDHPRHTDDVDTFGVSVQSIRWYLTLEANGKNRQTWETSGERYDHLIYDVRKFFSLLAKGNPNVHSWLWADPSDQVLVTPPGKVILDNRERFLSKACFSALVGYAKAQMHKMDRKRYQGYQGAKRKKIVDEVGYDVKHAAHCIRLLNMGIELATTGIMSTRRPRDEAAMLMEVKAGEWPFRKVETLSLELYRRFKECEPLSTLPEKPDMRDVNDLLVTVVEMAQ